MFNKFCVFLLHSCVQNSSKKEGSAVKEKNFSLKGKLSKFCPGRVEKGGKNENGIVASPESVPTHLNEI